MDDEIIHSWCFHDVECFDSTPSAAIIILDKDLESFSSLRSQQFFESISSNTEGEWTHLDHIIVFEDLMLYLIYDILEILWLDIHKS